MKTVMKKTKKAVKPAFIVDLTNVVTGKDALVMFGVAKASEGLEVTADEYIAALEAAITSVDCVKMFDEMIKLIFTKEEKKRNFWQRLKYLFTGK